MALNFWLEIGRKGVKVFPALDWENRRYIFQVMLVEANNKKKEGTIEDCYPVCTYRAEFDIQNQVLKTKVRDEKILRILKQVAFLFADDDEITIKLLRR